MTPPIDAWQVGSMRVTAFPSEVVPLDRLPWWDAAVGFPPETVVVRPKTEQYHAQGDYEGRRLGLQIQAGRIEWNLNPAAKAEEEEANLPVLGPFPDIITALSKIVTAWLPQAPALKRLAFGAVLLQPVENIRAGYLRVQEYLPSVQLDPDGSSDFFYQINRPRPAATRIQDLRINRLMRWSVQVAQLVTLMVDSGSAVGRTLNQEASCRLDLDINTAPNFSGVLPPEQLETLLREMWDLGREIAQRGDLP